MNYENDIAMAMAFPFPIFGNNGVSSVNKINKLNSIKEDDVNNDQDEAIDLKEDEEEEEKEKEIGMTNNPVEINDLFNNMSLNNNKYDSTIPVSRKRADSGISLGSEDNGDIPALNINKFNNSNNNNSSLLDQAIDMLGLIINGNKTNINNDSAKPQSNEKEEEVMDIYNTLLDLKSTIQLPDENEIITNINNQIVHSPTEDQEIKEETIKETISLSEAINQFEKDNQSVFDDDDDNATSTSLASLKEENYKVLFDSLLELDSTELNINSHAWNRTKEYIVRYLGNYTDFSRWTMDSSNKYIAIPVVVSFTLAIFFLNLSKFTINSLLKKKK
ncbi:hypothetical protein K502DRAFT_368752 [Neoconidiobolus thromboides FSU 785]|nr:hypothetical protein K502DRAFT_368752 [Neoconidiobolus thromboides FSU 785]